MIIDGKAISASLKESVKEEVLRRGLKLKLLVILVGDDPASQVYVASKEKACAQANIETDTVRLASDACEDEIIGIIDNANKDDTVDAILVQLPLPKWLNEERVINAIDPRKDVDGLTLINQGKLFNSKPGIIPATPKGIMKLLASTGVELAGKEAIVVGRSKLVGKPIASLLLSSNCTVTQAHSKTKDLDKVCARSDILVVAIGKDRMIKSNFIKPGAIVIDVGINRVDGKLHGDVDYDDVYDKVSYITPVPGGVGPMTIACLLENVIICHDLRVGK